jgi:transaldolase
VLNHCSLAFTQVISHVCYISYSQTHDHQPDDTTAIGKYKPQDATTNPSLILAATKKPEYASLIDVAVAYGKEHGTTIDDKTDATLDRLLVEFGKEILKIVPGKVSTEVDARFSFDTQASVNKALHIIEVGTLSPLRQSS